MSISINKHISVLLSYLDLFEDIQLLLTSAATKMQNSRYRHFMSKGGHLYATTAKIHLLSHHGMALHTQFNKHALSISLRDESAVTLHFQLQWRPKTCKLTFYEGGQLYVTFIIISMWQSCFIVHVQGTIAQWHDSNSPLQQSEINNISCSFTENLAVAFHFHLQKKKKPTRQVRMSEECNNIKDAAGLLFIHWTSSHNSTAFNTHHH